MTYLMDVPASLEAAVFAGRAYVTGALVKETATGLILAHLQPTARLGQSLMNSMSMGPVGAAAQLGSSLAQNFQLMKIQDMLETLQTVASVGTAASILNLGVSIGGFAMVAASLKRIEGTLGKVIDVATTIRDTQVADLLGVAAIAMERAESAFALGVASDRRRYWEEADLELARVIGMAVKRLAARGVFLERRDGEPTDAARRLMDPDAVDMLRWLSTVASARVEALLCLNMASEAARQARTMSQWSANLAHSPKVLAQAQIEGRAIPPGQISQIVNRATAVSTFVERTGTVATERAWLCENLNERGIDTLEYVLEVRNDPAERLLMLPVDDRAT